MIGWTNKADQDLVLPECPNFKREEFSCHCAHPHVNRIEQALPIALQRIRDHLCKMFPEYEWQVRINSAYRCPEQNIIIGGLPDSQHLYGTAADCRFFYRKKGAKKWIKCELRDYEKIYPIAYSFGCRGIGYKQYKGKFIHLDVRDGSEHRYGFALW